MLDTTDLSSWNETRLDVSWVDDTIYAVTALFKINTSYYFTTCYKSVSSTTNGNLEFRKFSDGSLVVNDSSFIDNGYEATLGYIDDVNDRYYYFYRATSTTFNIRYFDETTTTFSETLTSGGTLPETSTPLAILYRLLTKTLLICLSGSNLSIWVYSDIDSKWIEENNPSASGSVGFVWSTKSSTNEERKLIGFQSNGWNFKIYKDSHGKHIELSTIVRDGWNEWCCDSTVGKLSFLEGTITKGNRTLDISDVEINTTDGTVLILDDTYINYWGKGEIVTIYDYGGIKVCFEGFVDDYEEDESPTRKVFLKSPWISDLERKIEHEITSLKTTDAILEEITPLFISFMGINVSTGSVTYQPDFLGRAYGSIIENYAIREGWRVYVNYENMDFVVNDGLTDSGIDCLFNSGDKIENCEPIKKPYFVSECFVYGGIDTATGKRVVGYGRASVPDSGNVLILYEPNETDQTKLNTMAQKVVDTMENEILTITFGIVGKGCIQWGEQIDFEYSPYSDRMSELGSSAKYYVNEVTYYPMTDYIECSISNKLLVESADEIKDKVDSQEEMINQNALEINNKPDNVGDLGLTATTSEINNVADISLGSTAKNAHTHTPVASDPPVKHICLFTDSRLGTGWLWYSTDEYLKAGGIGTSEDLFVYLPIDSIRDTLKFNIRLFGSVGYTTYAYWYLQYIDKGGTWTTIVSGSQSNTATAGTYYDKTLSWTAFTPPNDRLYRILFRYTSTYSSGNFYLYGLTYGV